MDEPTHVPWLWDGLPGVLARPETLGFVLGALARGLPEHGDDDDRRLVRALVSLDGPCGDRVRIDTTGPDPSFRAFVARLRGMGVDLQRDGLSAWCGARRHDLVGAFDDLDPAVVHARCLPHYHGFLHAWTDAFTARERYLQWPAARRAAFLHEYLLYADNDARHGDPDPALQRAAAWLRARRRYLFRWTVSPREVPLDPAVGVRPFEDGLEEAFAVLADAICAEPEPWHRARLDTIASALRAPEAPLTPLRELLVRLGCDPLRLRQIRTWETLHDFVGSIGPVGGAREILAWRLEEVARRAW